ncbi:MAG: phosphoribosyltransferase [Salaquimonas sp.]|nr:phosphoribosyltransferase [Salaquimonas sp.]
MSRIFTNRAEAGHLLAIELAAKDYDKPVVLALPRGGVAVAAEIAEKLAAPLDLVLVRKISVPGQPELALGAIVDGEEPQTVLNEDVMRLVRLDNEALEAEKKRLLREIERRRALYLGDRERVAVEGTTAIVVDDGIATGATMRAALKALKRGFPARLVLAVPVAPPDTLERLSHEVDEIVCLERPADLQAIGYYYRDFSQLGDEDVIAILAAHPNR